MAERKLPEITALIEHSELVREWLESAARCECPSLTSARSSMIRPEPRTTMAATATDPNQPDPSSRR